MDNEYDKLCGLFVATVLLYVAHKAVKKKTRQKRRFKIRPINRARMRQGGLAYYKKMKEMDLPQFFKYTRMTLPVFQKLLKKLRPAITKQKRRDGLSAEDRLIITLNYLSQGSSMQQVAWHFQIGHATVHQIIHETCKAIWEALKDKYLKCPSTRTEWLKIAKGFNYRWNFPHCLGALDGKHVNIQAPSHSGSLFYNYKKAFSIVLLAACNSKYQFTCVDIGAYGSQSDGGILKNSIFGDKLEHGDLDIPDAENLQESDIKMPYFLVADEAFPLKLYIMRPYGGKNLSYNQRIFNYRLSRARQTIENSFGILVARWRLLKTTINAKPDNVDHIVKAVVALHNFCMIELGGANESMYCPPGYVDSDDKENGDWRKEQEPLKSVGRLGANFSRALLYKLRDKLAEYLLTDAGKVSWQHEIINRGRIFS